MGAVYIVGAGPGNIDNLTVSAYNAIKEADTLIYDRLIPDEIIALAKASCRKIYVGKEPGKESVRQSEINEIIYNEYRHGGVVVRLHAGDPFIFGRGGEEIRYLKSRNVECRIIPGLTTATSLAELHGVSLTDRSLSSSLVITTGHRDDESKEPIIFSPEESTIVILMGISTIRRNVSMLLDNGVRKDMPAMIVEKGLRGDERVLKTTVEDLPVACEKNGVTNPAVIIVGKVVQQ